MPARLRCFLYKKAAYSFLVRCLFLGSIMDSVSPGLSHLSQVGGSLGFDASGSMYCFHVLIPGRIPIFHFVIWDCRAEEYVHIWRVTHIRIFSHVLLVMYNGRFSSPHEHKDNRKLQGSLQTLLAIPYPGRPVALALQVPIFY